MDAMADGVGLPYPGVVLISRKGRSVVANETMLDVRARGCGFE